MAAYSSCWACYALYDEDMSNLPGSCKHCGREFTEPVTAPTTGVQVLCGPDGQWSIMGLSEDDMWTLASSLGYAATNCFNDTMDLERLAWVIETGLSD